MIKTQVQLPDELYKEARRIARERQMSLAEVMRRGIEYMSQVYPPLSSTRAVEICKVYRQNPKWRLVENAPVMESVWGKVNRSGFSRRKIFDIRLALILKHHGVAALATGNIKDFQDLGLHREWNPVFENPEE